jgi:hypothetical protein
MLYIAAVPSESAASIATSREQTVRRFFDAIRTGDAATLEEVLTPEAVTRWPQSGEQITGATGCIQVYANYPGGPPVYRIERVIGAGDVWVAELVADYGTERWYIASVIEFDGTRIARLTDWFGPQLPAPEWRRALVDPPAAAPQG